MLVAVVAILAGGAVYVMLSRVLLAFPIGALFGYWSARLTRVQSAQQAGLAFVLASWPLALFTGWLAGSVGSGLLLAAAFCALTPLLYWERWARRKRSGTVAGRLGIHVVAVAGAAYVPLSIWVLELYDRRVPSYWRVELEQWPFVALSIASAVCIVTLVFGIRALRDGLRGSVDPGDDDEVIQRDVPASYRTAARVKLPTFARLRWLAATVFAVEVFVLVCTGALFQHRLRVAAAQAEFQESVRRVEGESHACP